MITKKEYNNNSLKKKKTIGPAGCLRRKDEQNTALFPLFLSFFYYYYCYCRFFIIKERLRLRPSLRPLQPAFKRKLFKKIIRRFVVHR